MDVGFGIEWDLIDEDGNCCFDIQWKESDFNILSCHESLFQWNLENVTQSYTNAILKYHDKIKFILSVMLIHQNIWIFKL